jgi:flagellar protein FliO/FliZ
MSLKSKKILLLFLIIIVVSTVFIIARFGAATAGSSFNNQLVPSAQDRTANETEAKPTMTPDNDSMIMPMLKLFGALLLVVAGIYGFIYVLKRMMGGKFSANRKDNLIEVIETSFIAQKKSISLVRFTDRAVLVGVTDNGINVLAELNPEETAKVISDQSLERPVSGFRNVLKDARNGLMSLNLKKVKELHLTKDSKSPQAA